MKIVPAEVASAIKKEAAVFETAPRVKKAGRVLRVGDGIAYVEGLREVGSGELLVFENGAKGIALNLEAEQIGVAIMDSDIGIQERSLVMRTGMIASMPVGDELLGRVVDPLGNPLDGGNAIFTRNRRPIERIAPGVIAREEVTEPLETGIKAIDTMVPIGKGQRQLIIGDRQTGKTTIALDTILNQKGKDVYCIYVAIGQKTSTVADIVTNLTEYGAMSYTTVVFVSAAEPASLQYLAPYSGCAIGEEWMEQGKDVLIVYDDLSKHAVAYRTMSLLLHRPPGREAYPGDVFYLHSRLLERAGKLNKKYGGGSMTALPIIETQAGDMSAYIPTNVISITDGQIYLESALFNAGVRPALNPGLSVSRVGGAAQIPAMKEISGPVRTELAQYRELEAFSQFSSDLDKDTLRRIEHGKRIVEILKQYIHKPMSIENQIIVLFAAANGYFHDIPVLDIEECEHNMLGYIASWHPDIIEHLNSERKLTDKLKEDISSAIIEFISVYKN